MSKEILQAYKTEISTQIKKAPTDKQRELEVLLAK